MHLVNFIQVWDIPLGLNPEHNNFKQVEGMPLPRITISLYRTVRCGSPIRSWPIAIFGQLIPILGSSATGSGKMAAIHPQILYRTRKFSGSTLAVSTALVLTCPMDMSIQRLTRADPPEYGSKLTRMLSLKNFPICGTNPAPVIGN